MGRTRLWVPGLLYTTGAGDLRVGPSVGYRSHDPSFVDLRYGYAGHVTEWTHTAWVVPRIDLNAESADALGIIFPESLVDAQVQPHAHRWLREQELVAISGTTWDRVAATEARAFRVAFDATGDRQIRIDAACAGELVAAVVVAEDSLQAAVAAHDEGRAVLDTRGDPSAVDRLLRLSSNGLFGEEALLNAVDARRLVEEGYGYRGASEGWFREIDDVAHALRPLDALFGQVFGRAANGRGDAERAVAQIDASDAETGSVTVGGSTARAIAVPELRLSGADRLMLAGSEVPELVLPAEMRWSVRANKKDWSPTLSARVDVASSARPS